MKAYPMIKRIFDFILSLIGLIVLTPLFIVLGCLIRLNNEGPVFFRQRRVGQNGKIFKLYKFRSMRFSENSEEGKFEPGNTLRITTTGKFLRKTKLDELPQLINVLRGEMSIVGPRPEVEKWVAVHPEKWQRILAVRPGITDKASIEFNEEEKLLSASSDPENLYLNEILPRKLELCLEYADNHTFSGDIKIIFLTVKTVLFKC
jgi:lipopolysaccharide/colanic/teichoic acid biosynthesis glycosyltransferase